MNSEEKTNLLILSAGTRNKVVQYFKQTFAGRGKIVATDMSPLAPAIYEADTYYIVPPMTAPDYLEHVYDICKKEQIKGVLSLIDPELSLLAQHEGDFQRLGVTVIGSSHDLCELSLDKYNMYLWLKAHNYYCAKSYNDVGMFSRAIRQGDVSFPVFVKPRYGSASISISQADDMETVDLLFGHEQNMMAQEFLRGQEIGADVYIDMISGEVISVFTKKKIKMRAGETDKSVSFKAPELFALIEGFVKEAGFRGQIDIDIFEVEGKYYISEVNPRFGGGYPHAFECGCNHMQYILNNLQEKANERHIGEYEEGIYMMKYNEIAIRRDNANSQ